MRKRAKVDLTHGPIVDAFRAGGWQVLSLAPLGDDAADLLVKPKRKHQDCVICDSTLYLIEVKTGKRKLTPGQEEFSKAWGSHVLRSVQEAIEFMASH